MKLGIAGCALLFGLSLLSACEDDKMTAQQPLVITPCVADESGAVPVRDQPGTWQRVDIPGAICSDGSPYAIFVNYSNKSNDLIVMLEPGGACWDYGSCSPDGGLRGAANPNGLPPGIEHMKRFQFLPLMRVDDPKINPVQDYNKVFIPYCTGDIHTGNNTITYTGPAGQQLVFHHHGHQNILSSIAWINQTFTHVPRLLVTGCSAGGAGAIINYHYFRTGISGSQCGYLLDDSGPIFPSDGPSGPLHKKVRESWNTDSIVDDMKADLAKVGTTPDDLKKDFGRLNTVLADLHPNDRLATAVYRWDLNYSLYSYESFYNYPPYTEIHQLWQTDLAALRKLYETRQNLAYYMPFFRIDNCSHCVSIPPIGLDGSASDVGRAINTPWLGSEIQESSITLQDYVTHLLDDAQPLQSYYESDQPGEGFTPDQAAVCEAL